MENANKQSTALLDLYSLEDIPFFDPMSVDPDTIDQMILGHQLKYLEFLLQTEEEEKLALENIRDLKQYPIEIQEKAIEHSGKAMYDPDYFSRNQVDKELHKPIQIAGVIRAKKEEAKQKGWKVAYHARLVNRLRFFRKAYPGKKQSFFSKLFK